MAVGAGSAPPAASPHHTHWSLYLQGTVVFTTQVPALGRYAFLLHGYQPAHPTFAVEVLINGGRVWQGEWLWRVVEGTDPQTRRLLGVLSTWPHCVVTTHDMDR